MGADGTVTDAGPGRQAPVGGRAGWAACRCWAPRRGLRVLRGGHPGGGAVAARRRSAGDRGAVRADRPVGVGVHLGGRRADVRGDGEGGLDGGAPPVHLAAARVGRQVRVRAGRGAGRRLRHRLQRDRDRRRIDQDPPAGDAAAGVRRDRAVAGRGGVAVRVPARRAAVRAAAARRDRVRLGPAADAADRAGLDQGRDRVPEGRIRARPAHRARRPRSLPRSARRPGIDAAADWPRRPRPCGRGR